MRYYVPGLYILLTVLALMKPNFDIVGIFFMSYSLLLLVYIAIGVKGELFVLSILLCLIVLSHGIYHLFSLISVESFNPMIEIFTTAFIIIFAARFSKSVNKW